jgi:uncharacterized protein YfdQ (DUF2303 family)
MPNDTPVNRTEADAIIETMRDYAAAEVTDVVAPDGVRAPVMTVPRGMSVLAVKPFIDEFRTAPECRKGTAGFTDLASLIAHANRFKDADSALFANDSATVPSIVSVLDYHPQGPPKSGARFGRHRGVYAFPLSDEWKAWTAKSGFAMAQGDFASFIDDRILDIAPIENTSEMAQELAESFNVTFASPSRLRELSRGLALRVESKLHQAQNLESGESQIQFVTQHSDETGAPIKVPSAFMIGIPIFKSGEPYRIAVRLRYRVREAKLTWACELIHAQRLFDHAFRDACDRAAAETSLPLFYGTPE